MAQTERWKKDKRISFLVPADEFRKAKIKAAESGVTLSELGRAVISDDEYWERVARTKEESERNPEL